MENAVWVYLHDRIELENERRNLIDWCLWILENVSNKWFSFKADNITEFIAFLRDRIKQIDESVKLSATFWYNSPYGNSLRGEPLSFESEYKDFGQRWWEWVEKCLVDFLCPINYWLFPSKFEKILKYQLEKITYSIPLYSGLLNSNEF